MSVAAAPSMFSGESAAASDVHLPAEGHAEKEGTVTHPDGRVDVAEQDAVALVSDDGIGGDADAVPAAIVACHGARSAATNRGSRPREAGMRSPIPRPIVARTS